MRWSSCLSSAGTPWASRPRFVLKIAKAFPSRCVFLGSLLLSSVLLSGAPPAKRLSVYSVAANYALPVVQRDGRDYVGLLEVLEPLGKVSAKSDNRGGWRLRYNNV
ncbi:MAG TPA: hypothetical protein VFL34_00165, partial [Candidatus Sulfotelmatobacter sp.]|nr:hypothetical protein [Candidatus Sulfotelmatobacter sp.]